MATQYKLWLLFLLLGIILAVLLGIREAFRFKLLNSKHDKVYTFAAFIVSILYFVDLILMLVYSGWLLMIIGFIILFLIGLFTSLIVKRKYISFTENLFDEGDYESNQREITIQKVLNSEKIKNLMQEEEIGEDEIKDLYRRLHAIGVEKKNADSAIRNPMLISWFFKNYRDPSIDGNSLAIRLSIYAKYGRENI